MAQKKGKVKGILDSTSRRLKFFYRAVSTCKTVRISGVWGGVTPALDIQMSLFHERIPLPDSDELELYPESQTAKQVKTNQSSIGVIREIEAVVLMSPETAKATAEWLLRKVEEANELSKSGTTFIIEPEEGVGKQQEVKNDDVSE